MHRLTRVWLAIAAVAVLAAGAWMFSPAEPEDVAPEAAIQDPVAEYLAFVAGLEGGNSVVPADAHVIVDGLRRLAGALGVLEIGSSELPIDLRIAAEHVVLNPGDAGTADAVRAGLIAAADGLDDAAAREAAEAIDPRTPVSQQQERVTAFFQRAADVIRTVRVERPPA